jgi:hypothetical protein
VLKKEIDLAAVGETISQASPLVHRYSHVLISREIIQSSQIPIDARMLLVYLISFKEGWTFYDAKIRKDLGIGFSKLKSLFKQLRELGYVKTVPCMGEHGRMVGSKRLFSSIPEFNKKSKEAANSTESMEIRQSVEPTVRKSEPKIPNSIIKDDVYINNNKKINKKAFDNEFEEFWSINPKKVDKEEARAIFNRLLAEDYEDFQRIMDGRRAQNVVIELEGTEKKYIKGPAAWLRKRKFEDEVQTEEQLREENRRSIEKTTRQPVRESRVDRQFRILDEFEQAALRKQRAVQEELERVNTEIRETERLIEQAKREEYGNAEGHSCY